MLLSAVSVLVVVKPISEVPEGVTNYPVFITYFLLHGSVFVTSPSGRSLHYLLKNYMLFHCCSIGCTIKYKVYLVF
jgi:hypothetical protein